MNAHRGEDIRDRARKRWRVWFCLFVARRVFYTNSHKGERTLEEESIIRYFLPRTIDRMVYGDDRRDSKNNKDEDKNKDEDVNTTTSEAPGLEVYNCRKIDSKYNIFTYSTKVHFHHSEQLR